MGVHTLSTEPRGAVHGSGAVRGARASEASTKWRQNGEIRTIPSTPRDACRLTSLVQHMASVGTGWFSVMSWEILILGFTVLATEAGLWPFPLAVSVPSPW